MALVIAQMFALFGAMMDRGLDAIRTTLQAAPAQEMPSEPRD